MLSFRRACCCSSPGNLFLILHWTLQEAGTYPSRAHSIAWARTFPRPLLSHSWDSGAWRPRNKQAFHLARLWRSNCLRSMSLGCHSSSRSSPWPSDDCWSSWMNLLPGDRTSSWSATSCCSVLDSSRWAFADSVSRIRCSPDSGAASRWWLSVEYRAASMWRATVPYSPLTPEEQSRLWTNSTLS